MPCQLGRPAVEVAAWCHIMLIPTPPYLPFSLSRSALFLFLFPQISLCLSRADLRVRFLLLASALPSAVSVSFEFLLQILRKVVQGWQLIFDTEKFNHHWTTLLNAFWEGKGLGLFFYLAETTSSSKKSPP